MRHIGDVTLVAVTSVEIEAHVKALEYSSKELSFDRVLLLSDYNPNPKSTTYEHVSIGNLPDVGEWGRFLVFELHKYINTKYIILVHADGFIVNPQHWSDEFMNYDYIGAPWPLPKDNFSYRDFYGNIIRVGNSVSLRSKKLLELPSVLGLDWESADHGYFHEDGFLCVQNRHILQKHGVNYAPLSIACRFSREKPIPENRMIEPFAFHKWDGPNRGYPRFSNKATWIYGVKRMMRKIMSKIVEK